MPEAPHETLRRAAQSIRRVHVDDHDYLGLTRTTAPLLMALADEMADYPAVLVPNGVSIESQPNKPSPVWTAAYAAALAVLGEEGGQ